MRYNIAVDIVTQRNLKYPYVIQSDASCLMLRLVCVKHGQVSFVNCFCTIGCGVFCIVSIKLWQFKHECIEAAGKVLKELACSCISKISSWFF